MDEITKAASEAAERDKNNNSPLRERTIQAFLEVYAKMPAKDYKRLGYVFAIMKYLFQQGKVSSIDRNNVKPRLTEMRDAGIVKAIDRRVSPTTGRMTTVWQMADCR